MDDLRAPRRSPDALVDGAVDRVAADGTARRVGDMAPMAPMAVEDAHIRDGSSGSRWSRVVVVTATLVGVVLAGLWLMRAVSRQDSQPSVPVAPPVRGAVEVELVEVEAPVAALEDLLSTRESRDGVSAYRADGGPVAVVLDGITDPSVDPFGRTADCLGVESWYQGIRDTGPQAKPSRAGWPMSCSDPDAGIVQLFAYPHHETPDDAVVMYAWIGVPAETAYVTFTTSDDVYWQRPINHTVLFPIAVEPVSGTMRALTEHDAELASRDITRTYDGSQYRPGQPALHMARDPRYPHCAPLVGEDDLVPLIDHGTKLPVRITIEAFCDGTEGALPGQLPYSRSELADVGLVESRAFVHGEFHVVFVEVRPLPNGNGSITTDIVVSPDEVRRRVDAARDTTS